MAASQAIVKGIQDTTNEFMNNPQKVLEKAQKALGSCLLYTSPSPRD